MTGSVAYRAQQDVRDAFDVSDLQTFRGDNGIPYAIVSHNPNTGLLTDVWFGAFEREEQFRVVLEFVCDRFEEGGYHLWLADLRLLNSGFHHSEEWLAEYAFPRAIAGGLEREAVVLPSYRGAPPDYDVFGSASAALRKITDGRVKGFDDVDLAKNWLIDGVFPGSRPAG